MLIYVDARQTNKIELKEKYQIRTSFSYFIQTYQNLRHVNANWNRVWKEPVIILINKRQTSW